MDASMSVGAVGVTIMLDKREDELRNKPTLPPVSRPPADQWMQVPPGWLDAPSGY
jgi:hypothetical protein